LLSTAARAGSRERASSSRTRGRPAPDQATTSWGARDDTIPGWGRRGAAVGLGGRGVPTTQQRHGSRGQGGSEHGGRGLGDRRRRDVGREVGGCRQRVAGKVIA